MRIKINTLQTLDGMFHYQACVPLRNKGRNGVVGQVTLTKKGRVVWVSDFWTDPKYKHVASALVQRIRADLGNSPYIDSVRLLASSKDVIDAYTSVGFEFAGVLMEAPTKQEKQNG